MHPPKQGETIIAKYYARGEGSYQLIVKLNNGSVLLYNDDYVEPGYKIQIIVNPENITSKLIGII